VLLAPQPVGVLAAHIQRVAVDRRVPERVPVAGHGLLGHLLDADALDGGRGAEEVLRDEIGLEAHRVEDLRAAIGLVGGDAHLGHHLQEPLVDGLDVAVDDLVLVNLGRQVAALVHVGDGLESQIGVDRFGAVAGEAAEVVHLARLAGLDHEAHRGAKPLADEVVVHRGRGEQGRNRDAVGPNHPVGQDDDVVAPVHRGLGPVAQAVDGPVEPLGAGFHGIGDVEGLGVEAVLEMADAADLLQVLVGEDRLADLQALAARGALEIEDVGTRPDEGHEAHHELLADRVDRRVRDLGEVLLEIGVEELRLVGERRDRRVRAHGAHRLLARDGHGLHEELQVLLGIAEGLLAIEERHVGAALAGLDGAQVLQDDLGALEPFLVGMGLGERALHLVVGDDAALLQVDEEHLAGWRRHFSTMRSSAIGSTPNSEASTTRPSSVHEIAGRAQAVAVERRADLAPVR
jgi:hypothetical protein